MHDALRQRPDVIAVSEVRDTATAGALYEAIDSGHLVLASLHAPTPVDGLARFVSYFIIRDAWLNETELGHVVQSEDVADDSYPLWMEEMNPDDVLFPLAAREHLTEEEHSNILQRMVNGSIAHREDIIE